MLLKIAEPATNVSAPALYADAIVSLLMPPSISNLMSLPDESIIFLTFSTFLSDDSIKDCPPNPGFGGQSFIESSLKKVEKVRKMIDSSGKDIKLEIDGGINKDTIASAYSAGADTFVAGSAIFNSNNYEETISLFRKLAS